MTIQAPSHLDDVGPDDLFAPPSWSAIRTNFAYTTSAKKVVADFFLAEFGEHLKSLQVAAKQRIDGVQVLLFHFSKTGQRGLCREDSQLDHPSESRVAGDIGKVDIDKLGYVESAVIVPNRVRGSEYRSAGQRSQEVFSTDRAVETGVGSTTPAV